MINKIKRYFEYRNRIYGWSLWTYVSAVVLVALFALWLYGFSNAILDGIQSAQEK